MYKTFMLDNRISVILEKIPHFRSVSIGLWFGTGSVYEKENENGLSHFIEHMLFKGTSGRTAKRIAEEMDSVGGQLNAFTAKEYTCFYCKVTDEHIDLGLDLLSDMILNSRFREDDIEKEKGVILEEISMYEDSPEDLVHDLMAEAFFGKHPLSSPILGTKELLDKYGKGDLLDFMNRYYTPDNLVIAAAGNFDEDELLRLINRYFGSWRSNGVLKPYCPPAEYTSQFRFVKKDIEQVHLSLAMPGIVIGSEELYPMLILNNVFGGGMSSRLFQKIREDRGLTYSIYSYPSNYLSGGMFSIYAGMNPSQAEEVIKLIMDEIRQILDNGITEEEFHMGREQLKGNYILGMESTGSRMNAIGKSKLLLDKVMTPAEVIDKINCVTPEDTAQVSKLLFRPDRIAAAAVGNEDITGIIQNILKEGI